MYEDYDFYVILASMNGVLAESCAGFCCRQKKLYAHLSFERMALSRIIGLVSIYHSLTMAMF
jgi:hypothetical protein